MSTNEFLNWSYFLPYQSASYSQQFLRRIYEHQQMEEPLNKSYKNGYSFTYYLIHGRRFFNQARHSPYEIKPLLLFYGMIQLCKACLLTLDQDYPNTSTVLAHGVSTRKIKKQSFEFLQDTVLIQKRGLFSHMVQTLFKRESLEGQKFQMEELLTYIPELHPLYYKIKRKRLSFSVVLASENQFQVDRHILDPLKMTEERFFRFFDDYFTPINQQSSQEGKTPSLTFHLKDGCSKQAVFLSDQYDHLFLAAHRCHYPLIPELLIHYLLLYNLSMITRYETEWWNDLFFQRSSNDISFIQAYIDLSEKKVPLIVGQLLESLDPFFGHQKI